MDLQLLGGRALVALGPDQGSGDHTSLQDTDGIRERDSGVQKTHDHSVKFIFRHLFLRSRPAVNLLFDGRSPCRFHFRVRLAKALFQFVRRHIRE